MFDDYIFLILKWHKAEKKEENITPQMEIHQNQLGIQLCAGFPDTPHMFRGLIRALQGLFKTSYSSKFRPEDHTGRGEGRGPG